MSNVVQRLAGRASAARPDDAITCLGIRVAIERKVHIVHDQQPDFATIAGVQQSIVAIGTIIGPIFAGWVFDVSRSYEIAFISFIISVSIGAVICFFAKPPRPPYKH